jgi:hypothetical protein
LRQASHKNNLASKILICLFKIPLKVPFKILFKNFAWDFDRNFARIRRKFHSYYQKLKFYPSLFAIIIFKI